MTSTPGDDTLGPGELPLAAPHESDAAEDADAVREAALRAGLEAYELSDEDLAELGEAPQREQAILPILAVVGRPNVGKSTLVNRIIGQRAAVVEDVPGITRDRVTYPGEWAGRDFILMDTGGWETKVGGLELSVAKQAEVAIDMADAIVFVVDATVGPTATDEQVVKLLRKANKPVVLCANKVDGPRGEADAAELWALGLGEPYAVSALHGRGMGDFLDAAVAALPTELARESVAADAPEARRPRRAPQRREVQPAELPGGGAAGGGARRPGNHA